MNNCRGPGALGEPGMRVDLLLVHRELRGAVGNLITGLSAGRVCSQRRRASRGSPEAYPSASPSQHLQQHESGVEGEGCYYHCVLCSYSTKAKLNLIQHVRSMKHQRSESLRKLQRLQKGLPEEDEDLGQIFTIRRCPSTDPGECSCRPGRPSLGLAGCCPPWGLPGAAVSCGRLSRHAQVAVVF